MKKRRRYKLARITSPCSNGHSVRLRPEQGFFLRLPEVTRKWDIVLNSSFLIIERIEYDYEQNVVLVFINQKYDFPLQSRISNLFLGNVIVYNDIEQSVNCCVFLECANRKKYSVLTVVNPQNSLVRIDPHQLVEVVLFTDPFVHWEESYNDKFLELIRHETVLNDSESIYPQDDVFCPEPRNVELSTNLSLRECFNEVYEEKRKCDKSIEHHYWFRIRKEYLEKASDYPNGCYGLGRLKFKPLGAKGVACPVRCNLVANLRGTAREKIDLVLFDAIAYRAESWFHRYLDVGRRFLYAPAQLENIDIRSGQDFFFLEIPQPSTYYSDYGDHAVWKLDTEFAGKIKVNELEARTINGKQIQRFFVSNLADPKHILPSEAKKEVPLLGSIRFTCRKVVGSGDFNFKSLNISFWQRNKESVIAPQTTINAPKTEICTRSYSTYRPPVTSSTSSVTTKREEEKVIAEIELEHKPNAELGQGCYRVKFKSIGPLKKEIIYNTNASYGYEQYDEEELSSYWDKAHKKKEKFIM
jgi:hypothetical protein